MNRSPRDGLSHKTWKRSMKKQLASIFVLCLAAGMAHGDTFELSDPAAEIMEEYQEYTKNREVSEVNENYPAEAVSGAAGDTVCSEYLVYKQEQSQRYWSGLYWVQGFMEGAGDPHDTSETASWLENYCHEHPSSSLARAAEAFMDE
jgi:hypothetical protein